jgi:hypothetical protein
MKRRSPWLTFAACALMGGTALSRSATDVRTALKPPRMTDVARAVEAELEKRGLSKTHYVSSLSLVQSGKCTPFYLARIQPPVFLIAHKELSFHVTMNGQVSESGDSDPCPVQDGKELSG